MDVQAPHRDDVAQLGQTGSAGVARGRRAADAICERLIAGIYRRVANAVGLPHARFGYVSRVATFGGTVRRVDDGALIWDARGGWNRFDRVGDRLVRITDDNVTRRPGAMLRRHPRRFWRLLRSGPKRARGGSAEIAANAARLGLAEYYGPHPHGVAIKRPEILTEGVNLHDLYAPTGTHFHGVDRHACLVVAARYIRRLHDEAGALGELHPSDIIFMHAEGPVFAEPVLDLPDIVYNPAKYAPADVRRRTELRALELFEFLLAIGTAELRRGGNWRSVEGAFEATLRGYADARVIEATASLARRGRLTLADTEGLFGLPERLARWIRPYVAAHNRVRLGVTADLAAPLRALVIAQCSRFGT